MSREMIAIVKKLSGVSMKFHAVERLSSLLSTSTTTIKVPNGQRHEKAFKIIAQFMSDARN